MYPGSMTSSRRVYPCSSSTPQLLSARTLPLAPRRSTETSEHDAPHRNMRYPLTRTVRFAAPRAMSFHRAGELREVS